MLLVGCHHWAALQGDSICRLPKAKEQTAPFPLWPLNVLSIFYCISAPFFFSTEKDHFWPPSNQSTLPSSILTFFFFLR